MNAKTAVIERATHIPGVRVLLRESADRVCATYDPQQINALDARLLLNIFVDYTEGQQADGLRELGRNADPTSRELYTVLLEEIDRSGDASGVVQRALDLMGQAIRDRSRR
ncbi:hypothetical protein ACFXHD_17885 [Streptomyces hydrogenans]|uniref:hypothetical protein n=1 Tax=Streptomyces hydrogenans TaxID=1873719 RepID=UPI0036C8B43B